MITYLVDISIINSGGSILIIVIGVEGDIIFYDKGVLRI